MKMLNTKFFSFKFNKHCMDLKGISILFLLLLRKFIFLVCID